MCRWLAYSGSPIYLETLLTKPSRSLVVQSRFARENFVEGMAEFPDGAFPTNGDGFVLSEPLDECTGCWEMVPESSFMVVRNGEIEISPFEPPSN